LPNLNPSAEIRCKKRTHNYNISIGNVIDKLL
jgi:hypothetical protein